MSEVNGVNELETWKDLLKVLEKMSPEQLAQRVQICAGHPCDENVYALAQGVCIGTIDELNIRYARSVTDNRRHGEHFVIYTDGNPFAEDGAISYEVDFSKSDGLFGREKPNYPKDYDDSQNWTGPAQKLADQTPRKKGRGTLGPVLVNRLRGYHEGSTAEEARNSPTE